MEIMMTKPEEVLQPAIEKILEGIEEFNRGVSARINNAGEWKSMHLAEANRLRMKLLALAPELAEKAKEWS